MKNVIHVGIRHAVGAAISLALVCGVLLVAQPGEAEAAGSQKAGEPVILYLPPIPFPPAQQSIGYQKTCFTVGMTAARKASSCSVNNTRHSEQTMPVETRYRYQNDRLVIHPWPIPLMLWGHLYQTRQRQDGRDNNFLVGNLKAGIMIPFAGGG